jgi:hypothetical protein
MPARLKTQVLQRTWRSWQTEQHHGGGEGGCPCLMPQRVQGDERVRQELPKWSSLQPGEALDFSAKSRTVMGECRSGRATPAVQRGSVPRMLLLELNS